VAGNGIYYYPCFWKQLHTVRFDTYRVQIDIAFEKEINNAGIVSVSAGWNHSLAIDEFGNLWMWGTKFSEELAREQKLGKQVCC